MGNNKKQKDNRQEILKKWEYNLIFSLIILLIIATLMDLKVSFGEILKIISQ
ncbi:MAG: hypothetical protein ACOC1O_03755 [bacterium]